MELILTDNCFMCGVSYPRLNPEHRDFEFALNNSSFEFVHANHHNVCSDCYVGALEHSRLYLVRVIEEDYTMRLLYIKSSNEGVGFYIPAPTSDNEDIVDNMKKEIEIYSAGGTTHIEDSNLISTSFYSSEVRDLITTDSLPQDILDL